MKEIPFEVAKQFCEDYQKDQCVILSWDKESGKTWVTTFGVGDENSIQATNSGKMLKDYLKLQRENDVIPTRFEEWEIESVDRWRQVDGRNSWLYKEVTHWFEKHTLQRKETVRQASIYTGQEYSLPEWAQGITKRIKTSADDRCY